MTKEEYGNLLKYLGILRYSIHQLRDSENDYDIDDDIILAIKKIIDAMPLLEQYIKN